MKTKVWRMLALLWLAVACPGLLAPPLSAQGPKLRHALDRIPDPASTSVESVAFSPDGRTLASGSDNNRIKIWDVATGRERATLKGNPRVVVFRVFSVAFSPDGKMLAWGGGGGNIGGGGGGGITKLWDLVTGREKATLLGQDEEVFAVAFSPDGKTLASGSADGTIKLWDVATGKEKDTLKGRQWLRSVAFSPDGKTLASGGDNSLITLWDVKTGAERAALKGHKERVHCVVFSLDGKTLASASDDKTLKLWDVETGKERATLKGKDPLNSVAFSPDGKTLASAGLDFSVGLWDVESGKEQFILRGHTSMVLSVAFSPDGKTLASGANDGKIKLWHLTTNKPNIPEESKLKNIHPKDSKSERGIPDGQARKGALFKLPPIGGAALTPDNKKLIVSIPSEAKLAYFDLMNDEEIKRLAVDFKPTVLVVQGKKLIAATEGSPVIHILDRETLEELKSVRLPGGGVTGLACHPEKGLVYAVNLKFEIHAVDAVAGTAHKTKARGHLIAVDRANDQFVYTAVLEPIPDDPSLSKLSDRMVMRKYTISGTDLEQSDASDNPAFTGADARNSYPRQRGLGLSPDGKFAAIASGAGWRSKADNSEGKMPNYAVAAFDTSDLKTVVGQVDSGPHPGAIAFHPILNLGVVYCDKYQSGYPQFAGNGAELVIFNQKSLATKETLKVLSGTESPVLLAFGGQGTKVVICPLGLPLLRKQEVALQIIPLSLTEADRDTLKKAYPVR